jgi:hypothetical protein
MVVGAFALLGQIVTGAFAVLQSKRNERHIKAAIVKVDSVAVAQEETKHELNSRLSELVESVRNAARAAGILEGIEQQKNQEQAALHPGTLADKLEKIIHTQAGPGTPGKPPATQPK